MFNTDWLNKRDSIRLLELTMRFSEYWLTIHNLTNLFWIRKDWEFIKRTNSLEKTLQRFEWYKQWLEQPIDILVEVEDDYIDNEMDAIKQINRINKSNYSHSKKSQPKPSKKSK